MNRRDFLRPRQLTQAAGQVLGALGEVVSPDPLPPPESLALIRLSRRAMATTFEIALPFGTPGAVEAAEEALDEIDRLEAQLTVYRETSEVSLLNRHAAGAWIPVEAGLFGLLERARQISAATEGAFDVSVGALIKAWGFYRRRGRVPTEQERAEVLPRVGMQHILLDGQRRAVRFAVAGLEINLGSIGKGYAIDRAAALVRQRWGIRAALLHGGHSSLYALGAEPGQRGWPVGLRHPWDPARRLGIVWLRDRALATSAATFQHLEYNGRKLGHVLDPRSGWPAEGIASATVLAPTAAEADALSTAFFILGAEKARAYCAAHPEVSAVLLPAGEDDRPILLGLAPDEMDGATRKAGRGASPPP